MKIVNINKSASFNYQLLEHFEAGIVLTGSEVKSVRGGGVNLKGSFARVIGNEIFLVSAHISKYSGDSNLDYDPKQDRKLLLHKKEIYKIAQVIKEQSLTLIPTKIYFIRGKVKVEIALARGKKNYDKRETVKKREYERNLRSTNKKW